MRVQKRGARAVEAERLHLDKAAQDSHWAEKVAFYRGGKEEAFLLGTLGDEVSEFRLSFTWFCSNVRLGADTSLFGDRLDIDSIKLCQGPIEASGYLQLCANARRGSGAAM